jgi:hypothetical protein
MGNAKPTLNTHFCVRNIANTTNVIQGGGKWRRRCSCGSWMDHWRAGVLLYFPNIHPDVYLNPPCYVRGCRSLGIMGAHVLEVDGRATQYWKIIPFCEQHNNHTFTEDVFLTKDAILVPATQKDTCMNNKIWADAVSVIRIMRGDSV